MSANDDEKPPVNKKPRLECFECQDGPDVVVIVGDTEFEEYSHNLRCWSGYFDGAFRSGMKESESKRFEFPDKDPKEWELIRSLFVPLSKAKVTQENYPILHPWFEMLCCKSGLDDCDDVVCKVVSRVRVKKSTGCVERIVSVATKCIEWNRNIPKDKCLDVLKSVLQDPSDWTLDATGVLSILALVAKDESVCKTLWPLVKTFLPSEMATSEFQGDGIHSGLQDNIAVNEFIQLKLEAMKGMKAAATLHSLVQRIKTLVSEDQDLNNPFDEAPFSEVVDGHLRYDKQFVRAFDAVFDN
ncbi:expressed unknown protein [Seminavis robusta]|uniref:BTB domain-containing protein n=1 Tax=Seminavis robusta TaxID=568900 RepID=A0A9N8DH93_9STRA|nr:expressed unknown protein [Seminavis robusta]|eukprot:Sro66_g037040.1 n/a (299) ;mRNA; f:6041-6937